MVETEATRLAPDESAALGRKARATVPRSSHASLPSDPDRPDPVTLLQSQANRRPAGSPSWSRSGTAG